MKLLICDDDISTVDVIQSQLDCAELGISRILRAYNGEAAIRMVESQRPDIILCDIGMPKVNGIEVLKYIYEHKIPGEFCFLTCYEDFEYAKSAIRYGASSYITKPFDIDDLKSELKRMILSARRRQEIARQDSQTRQDSVLNSVLRQIGDGLLGSSAEMVDAALRRNGLALSASASWYLVLSCADVTDPIDGHWSRELLMYSMGRFHDEALAEHIGSAYCIVDYSGRFLMCTCFIPGAGLSRQALLARCEKLLQQCRAYIGIRPSILVSGAFPLYQAAQVKNDLLGKLPRIRVRAGRIFTMENVDSSSEQQLGFLDANQILLDLKRFDRRAYLEYIGTVIRTIEQSEDYTREVMDDFRRELTHIFQVCLRDNGLPVQPVFSADGLSVERAVLSAEHMLRFADRLFSVTEEQLRELADTEDIIARADAYIREHFRENISREDVAAVACITPNYLSKQFHSKKGMNLREYINKIRIDEAKRLLLTTNLSVSDVAGMAGYDNISYFSTVFRKYTGMSPVDWRTAKEAVGSEAK